MRGYIRKRGKDSWSLTASAGFDATSGRRRQVYRTVRGTKRDAERELTKLLREIDQGTLADSGRARLAEYLDRYLAYLATRIRPKTHRRYEQLVRRHIAARIGSVPLSKLRPADVQAVVDGMLAEGLAPRTVIQAYRVLSAALRQGVRWQILAVNPATAVSPPRPERPRLSVPDTEAIGKLLRASEGTSLHVPLVLAVSSGMRRGEVLGLRWSSVDLDAGIVRVVSTLQQVGQSVSFADPKTDRARRTIALPPFAVEVLRTHRREQNERRLLLGEAWQDLDLVIDRGDGAPVAPDVFSRSFQRLARRIGLDGCRLHDLRHAFATTLLAGGVHPKIASEALGHASVAFTMDTYSHVLPTMQEQAAAAIQEALGDA